MPKIYYHTHEPTTNAETTMITMMTTTPMAGNEFLRSPHYSQLHQFAVHICILSENSENELSNCQSQKSIDKMLYRIDRAEAGRIIARRFKQMKSDCCVQFEIQFHNQRRRQQQQQQAASVLNIFRFGNMFTNKKREHF